LQLEIFTLGSSPSVYGIFSWDDLGVLSATYTLDGNTLPASISVTASTFEYMNDYGQASNVLLFSNDTVQPGDHTLVINITQCVNQTFMLDYITYLPSFTTLATMPNLTATTTSAANASTSTQPTESQATSQINNGGDSRGTPIGAIVGGLVGGLAFIAILIFLLFWWRKRGAVKQSDLQDDLITHTRETDILPLG
jgi:hypothetical protein